MKKRALLIICCLTLGFTPLSFAGSLDGTLWHGELLFIFTYQFEIGFYGDYMYFHLSYPPYIDNGFKRSQNTYTTTENIDGSTNYSSWAINAYYMPVFYWGISDINKGETFYNAFALPFFYTYVDCDLVSSDWTPEGEVAEGNATDPLDIFTPLFLGAE